jgi:hypothetical protein
MIINNQSVNHAHPLRHPASFTRTDSVLEPLYVIAPIFNPQRYRTRWKLYKEFENYVLSNNQAHLVTIECTFGHREKVMTEQISDKHTVLHIQTSHELWLKENMINIAISRLPENWKYVAWVDADVRFTRPDWVGETIQQLQHYHLVQMWTQAIDLMPNFEHRHKVQFSFMWSYLNQSSVPNANNYYYTIGSNMKGYWHPGYAWAARREAINDLGGLIDWSILGSADTLMAHALIGNISEKNKPSYINGRMFEQLMEWQNRAEKHIKRNVGFVEGLITHYWHGKKVNRGYNTRGNILVENDFNPDLDLKKDWQGAYQLTDRNFKLRDDIRGYFRMRNEDGIDE